MSRTATASAALVATLGVALLGCGSSDSGGHGGLVEELDASASETSSHDATTDVGEAAADAPGDALADAAADATAEPEDDATADAGDEGDGAPVLDPPVCPPDRVWDVAAVLPLSTTDDDVLAAITPDELTIAWFSGAGATAALHYADRATTADAFVESGQIADVPVDRVALSPDGLRVAVVAADRRSVAERTRGARGDAFDAPSEGAFGVIDGWLATQPNELLLGDLVLDATDRVLFFSTYGTSDTTTVRYALRIFSNESWSVPAGASDGALVATAGGRKRPTGISSDGRTLFSWDTETSIESASLRDGPIAPFSITAPLGARPFAQPNASCTRLYHSETHGASLDIVVAEAK